MSDVLKPVADWAVEAGLDCPPKPVDEYADSFAADPCENESPELPANPFRELVQDAADIMAEKLPDVIQIIFGIVCDRSKLLIASGSKSFKTWLTIQIALCVAHGVPLLGRQCLRSKVLYVNLELKSATFKRRIQAQAKALGIEVEQGQLVHLPLRGKIAGMPLSVVVDRISMVAKEIGASVIVVDPVYKLNTVGDENSAKEMTELFNQLDRLTTEAGATVIINDHFGKGNQSEKDPLDAIRGSSAKGGDVDAAMVLRRHETEECFRVDMVHRELPPVPPFSIGWKFPLMEVRPDLDPEQMKQVKPGRKAKDPLKLLEKIKDTTAENPISVTDWAVALKMERQTLSGYVPEMHQKGWISTVGDGNKARRYITEKGVKALENLEVTACRN